ncbi:MAG: ATP-binding cassette domain-containing protein [Christensenellales bacterium]|jgi:peptide/nickel transport system ATP-binding protein
MKELLDIKNLTVRYLGAEKEAVSNFSFTLGKGEILCLRGRSGSGKSTVAAAIMGLLNEYEAEASGEVLYRGENLLTLSDKDMRSIRWREIAMVPQSSMNAFNPVYTLSRTLREMMLLGDKSISKSEMRERELMLMDMVHLDKKVLGCFAHEMSGGMKQRAAIALAMVYSPKILILDEATTGLDIKIQADVLGTLLSIKKKSNMAMLFISHDAILGDKLADRKVEMP